MSDAIDLAAKSIRKATAELLKGKTAAGDRVFGFRTTPVPAAKLPCLLVYINSQNDQSISIADPVYRCTLDLAVECLTDGADDETLGDATDDFCAAIKIALLKDPEWPEQVERIPAIRTDLIAVIDGARRMAGAKLVFSLVYVVEDYPDTSEAPDLSTVTIKADTLPTDGSFEAVAELDLT